MTEQQRNQLIEETKTFIQANTRTDPEHPERNPSPAPTVVIPEMQKRHPRVDLDDLYEIARDAYELAAKEAREHARELDRFRAVARASKN